MGKRKIGSRPGKVSAFNIFCKAQRADLTQENPDKSASAINTLLGETWRALAADQKALYEAQALADLPRYEKELAEWEQQQPGDANSEVREPAEKKKKKKKGGDDNGEQEIWSDLECPVCSDLMDEIVACPNGHLVCVPCHAKLDGSCPTCRVAFGDSPPRQLYLERLATQRGRSCPLGCGQWCANKAAMDAHTPECRKHPDRFFTCGCGKDMLTQAGLVKHLLDGCDDDDDTVVTTTPTFKRIPRDHFLASDMFTRDQLLVQSPEGQFLVTLRAIYPYVSVRAKEVRHPDAPPKRGHGLSIRVHGSNESTDVFSVQAFDLPGWDDRPRTVVMIPYQQAEKMGDLTLECVCKKKKKRKKPAAVNEAAPAAVNEAEPIEISSD